MSTTAAANAGNLFGSLAPQLTAEATNPQGYGAPTLAKIDTANKQTAGGTQAGAVGQGALLAARTRNAGTADAAIILGDQIIVEDLKYGTGEKIDAMVDAEAQTKRGVRLVG
jgi:hypothetical protein